MVPCRASLCKMCAKFTKKKYSIKNNNYCEWRHHVQHCALRLPTPSSYLPTWYGAFINDVAQFLRFLTRSLPLVTHFTKKAYGVMSAFGRSPPRLSGWRHLWMAPMYVCIVSTKEKRNDKLIRLASLQHGWVEEARGGREALPKVTNVLLNFEVYTNIITK